MLTKDDISNQFLQEEYKSLRQEILDRMRTQKQLEVFSLTALGLIWGTEYFRHQSTSSQWIGVCAGLVVLATSILASYEATAIFRIGSFIAARYEHNAPFKLCWESLTQTRLAHTLEKVLRKPTSSLSQVKYRDRGLFADISKNDIFGKETANEKVYS